MCSGSGRCEEELITIQCNMQKQENNSNNQLQISALSNISWQKWQLRIFVAESALYRTANWIDEKEHELLAAGKPFNEALLGAAEEYAIECAMLESIWQ